MPPAHGFVDRERAGGKSEKYPRGLGVRAGNWLTSETTKELLLAPEEGTLKGQRDRSLLGVLVGCGLRREELVNLEVADLEMREDRWTIPHLIGKGRRVRLVPVPGWVKERVDVGPLTPAFERTESSGRLTGRGWRASR